MLQTLHHLFQERKYVAISTASASVVFLLYWYVTFQTFSFSAISGFVEWNGNTYTLLSILLNTILSLLTGVAISIALHAHTLRKKTTAGTTFGATLLGISASGCPACGALVPSLLGVPLGLSALPFKGIEFKVLGILLLLGTLLYATKNTHCKRK